MKQARWQFAGLCTWFFLLYNIERIGEPINLASFVYVYTLLVALATILLPGVKSTSGFTILLLMLPPYFLAKIVLDIPILGSTLPLTVTEIFAISMTMLITRQLRFSLESLFTVVSALTIDAASEAQAFSSGQGQIYREIRRARRYKRPVTLLSLAPNEASLDWAFVRYIQEVQQKIVRKYIETSLSKILITELQDCDVVTLRDDHFVILLPEMQKEEASKVVEKLISVVQNDLSLTLKMGMATFPDEEVTFEGLLARAEDQMKRQYEE